jgi:hypothetical protein
MRNILNAYTTAFCEIKNRILASRSYDLDQLIANIFLIILAAANPYTLKIRL